MTRYVVWHLASYGWGHDRVSASSPEEAKEKVVGKVPSAREAYVYPASYETVFSRRPYGEEREL